MGVRAEGHVMIDGVARGPGHSMIACVEGRSVRSGGWSKVCVQGRMTQMDDEHLQHALSLMQRSAGDASRPPPQHTVVTQPPTGARR